MKTDENYELYLLGLTNIYAIVRVGRSSGNATLEIFYFDESNYYITTFHLHRPSEAIVLRTVTVAENEQIILLHTIDDFPLLIIIVLGLIRRHFSADVADRALVPSEKPHENYLAVGNVFQY